MKTDLDPLLRLGSQTKLLRFSPPSARVLENSNELPKPKPLLFLLPPLVLSRSVSLSPLLRQRPLRRSRLVLLVSLSLSFSIPFAPLQTNPHPFASLSLPSRGSVSLLSPLRSRRISNAPDLSSSSSSLRRTPKMKSKFNFTVGEPWAAPFVSLLRGHREEIVLRESKQLDLILEAAGEAIEIGCPQDVMEKLEKLQDVLERKKDLVRPTSLPSLLFSFSTRLNSRR